MKTKLVLVGAFAAALLSAQNQPVLGEQTVKVSDHVWAIMGFPNYSDHCGEPRDPLCC